MSVNHPVPPHPQQHHVRVSRACHHCHISKAGCDGNRPCHRCSRLGKLCRNRAPTEKELRLMQGNAHQANETADKKTTTGRDNRNAHIQQTRSVFSSDAPHFNPESVVPMIPVSNHQSIEMTPAPTVTAGVPPGNHAPLTLVNSPFNMPFKDNSSVEFDTSSYRSLPAVDQQAFLSPNQPPMQTSFLGDPWFLNSAFILPAAAQQQQLHQSMNQPRSSPLSISMEDQLSSESMQAVSTNAGVGGTRLFTPNTNTNAVNNIIDSANIPPPHFTPLNPVQLPSSAAGTPRVAPRDPVIDLYAETPQGVPPVHPPTSTSTNSHMPVLSRVMVENHATLGSMKMFRSQLERREITARRIQFYFCQLSEILDATSFASLAAELPVHIPLSTRAPYSITEAAIAYAKLNPAARVATDSNPTLTLVQSPSISLLSYVEFNWHSSPLTALSDRVSCGIAGPLALLRIVRKGPFLEDSQQFADRYRKFVRRLAPTKNRTKSRKRKKSSKSFDAGHKKKKKHRRKHDSNGIYAQSSSSSNLAQMNNVPVVDGGETSMQHTATVAASSNKQSDRHSSQLNVGNGYRNTSDESSSSSSSDTDSGEEDEDQLSDDEFDFASSSSATPTDSKYHLPSCPVAMSADGVAVNSSSAASLSSDPSATALSPTPSTPMQTGHCQCPTLQRVPMSVQVNADWERLFGMTQSELRDLMKKEGAKAIHRFTRLDRAGINHRTKVEAILGVNSDYKYFSIILNKWGGEVHCLVHAHLVYDEGGTLLESVHSWTPLP